MNAKSQGEDILLLEGAVVLNAVEARQLAGQLYRAADEAFHYGLEAERKTEAAMGERDEAPFPVSETPAKPKHNVALLFDGPVLRSVEIVEGCPPRLQRNNFLEGGFVYALDTVVPHYLYRPGGTVVVLSYNLVERV